VNLSDLAKYAVTRSIVRPLCDSRATCNITDIAYSTDIDTVGSFL